MTNTMSPRFARRARAVVLAAAAPMALSVAGLPARAQVATPPSFAVNAGTIGSVVTSGDGLTTTITQTSQRAVLDWQTLSVASGNRLEFSQPNAGAITLNRVAAGGPGTVIDGTISANGKVWILDPSGLFIGAAGRINTAGFLASTGSINTADFMASANRLTISGITEAGIVNEGQITINAAAGTGYAVLAGMQVHNGQAFVSGVTTAEAGNALITAELNSIVLGSGNAFTLDFAGDGLISFAIAQDLTSQETGGGIFNSGTISAAGGTVLMTSRAAAGAVGAVINTDGLVEARSVTLANGTIKLGSVEYAAGTNGTVSISGITDVSAGKGPQAGGTILATGDTIIVSSSAILDAHGQGGGNIRLGAAPTIPDQPAPPVATWVEVAANAVLDASATVHGNGGLIILRSATGTVAGTTIAQGIFRASGGSSSGNGGQINISGTTVNARGIIINAAASNGTAGQFTLTAPRFDILDPTASGDNAWLSAPLAQLIGPTGATATTLPDDAVTSVPLGFALTLGDTTVESVFLSSNGFLSFTNIGQGCCNGLPIGSAPSGAIYGLWTDLIDSAGSPFYQTRTLENGSKQFVAGWYNTSEFPTAIGNLNSFEILLSDTGKVQLNYGGINVTNHLVTAGVVGVGDAAILPLYHGNRPDGLSYQSFSLARTAGTINAEDVASILGNGTNVTIVAAGAAPAGLFPEGLGTLTLAAPLALSATSNTLLTLSAAHDLLIGPAGEIASGPNARFNFIADSDNDGNGLLRLDASLKMSTGLKDGLIGTRYDGYYNDNYTYFDNALVVSDSRFDNPFTAINSFTPGQDFGENYSARFVGYFLAPQSGSYTFATVSDDASHFFIGNAGESTESFLARFANTSPLVNNGGIHPPQYQENSINLSEGSYYPITLLFGEASGGDVVELSFFDPILGGMTTNGLGFYYNGTLISGSGNGQIQLSGNIVIAGDRSLVSQGALSVTGNINAVQPGLASIKLEAMNAPLIVTGAIGNTSRLESLDVNASSFTSGSINTGAGDITLDVSDASVVQGGVTANSLRISGSGRLWLNGRSNQIATLTIADGWLYTDKIGGIATTPIVFDGAGNNILEIESTTPAMLANPITLNAAADIELRGNVDWTIVSAIDAASQTEGGTHLAIHAQGNLLLNSVIGGIQPLASIDVLASGKLQLGSNASITTVGEIRLGGSAGFSNESTASVPLNPQGSRWLIWSGNPTPFSVLNGDNLGNLIHNFRYYGIIFDQIENITSFPEFPSQGNGIGYAITPTLSIVSAGPITKVYDGTSFANVADYQIGVSGALNGDIVNLSIAGVRFDRSDVLATRLELLDKSIEVVDSFGKPVVGYGLTPLTGGGLPATITPRPLAVGLTGMVERVYDGTTNA
ncbi:beta strand repeat-containing protein, partial [Sandarakinorhabdus sp.]|uniref:beta strand repeat-containing protein n=1 Tax=Sandarakinorhabdus sp. TaxID=1916663 RepID=UPI003F6F5B57